MSETLKPETTDDIQQERLAPPALVAGQTRELVQYVEEATDLALRKNDYDKALRRMDTMSRQAGIAPEGGRIAVTAATIGALTRDPNALRLSGDGLTKRMVSEMGLNETQVAGFRTLINGFGAQRTPAAIGHHLHQGLQHLEKRTKERGEDTSLTRIAFLASGFAATQDRSLRQAIYKDLQAATRPR